MHRLAVFLSSLVLAGAASASLQPLNLDFEADWADLPPNSFVQIASLAAAPGGLHWGDAWYGQTTAPVLGSNNELRLGATGSTAVDYFNRPFHLDSIAFGNFQAGGQTTDRNLFVMDNLQLRLEPAVSAVPEPASAALALAGLALLVGGRRLRRR